VTLPGPTRWARPGSRAVPWIAAVLATLWCADTALAQSPTMRERIYQRLSKAQVAADAGDTAKALEILREVEKTKDLSPYEMAQLHTAFGFVEYSRENYREAVSHYQTVLRQEGLPPAMISLSRYTLAQLHFIVEDYEAAANEITKWLEAATSPGPEPYVLLGQAFYKLERYGDAIPPLETAISIAEAGGRQVRENWYLLLRVLHYERGDWPKVLEVLELLVARFPKKEYWIQLAATYGEVGDAPNRLASYDAAYLQGLLDRHEDVVTYAQLLIQAGAPYRGAVVLDRGLEQKVVERSARMYRLLSDAWTMAREADRAIRALSSAAELSENGEADARLAQLHLNREESEKAVEASRRALAKGVEGRGQVQCVLGMALFELERFDEATSAFDKALDSPSTRQTASQWIAFIEREQERIRQLESGLERP